MSIDAWNYLPKGTCVKDVEESLILMGYAKQRYADGQDFWWHWANDDYKSFVGIEASVSEFENKCSVGTHTRAGRSRYEVEMQNNTMRLLATWFGGNIGSDLGEGEYLRIEYGEDREKSDAGCYLAHQQAGGNMMNLDINLISRSFKQKYPDPDASFFPKHPEIISNNLMVPYLVSTFETYARATYVALLKYSENKLAIMKKIRFRESDLVDISDGLVTIEEAYANCISFQNLDRIWEQFCGLNKKLDIHAALQKSDKDLWGRLNDIINSRHEIIHRSSILFEYKTEKLEGDIAVIKKSIDAIYGSICDLFGWDKGCISA